MGWPDREKASLPAPQELANYRSWSSIRNGSDALAAGIRRRLELADHPQRIQHPLVEAGEAAHLGRIALATSCQHRRCQRLLLGCRQQGIRLLLHLIQLGQVVGQRLEHLLQGVRP